MTSRNQASDGTPLTRGLATLDGWTETRAKLDALSAVRLPTAVDIDLALADRLRGRLDTAGDPTGFLDEAAKAHAELTGQVAAGRAVEKLRTSLTSELANIERAGTEHLRRHLNDELGDLLTDASNTLEALVGVSDAESAADDGVLDQYKRMRQIRVEYETLRKDQTHLWQKSETQGRRMRDLVTAYIADPMATDPEFIPRRLGRRVEGTHDLTREPRPAPWPDLARGDAVDWLVAHPQAKPWVPSSSELDEAEEQIRAACQQATEEHREGRTGSPARARLA